MEMGRKESQKGDKEIAKGGVKWEANIGQKVGNMTEKGGQRRFQNSGEKRGK